MFVVEYAEYGPVSPAFANRESAELWAECATEAGFPVSGIVDLSTVPAPTQEQQDRWQGEAELRANCQ